jgi:carbamoyltransferase
MTIIGLSAFYHDSAACLIKDGQIIAAAEEERFTRVKHDSRFPTNAIDYCLRAGHLSMSDVECVAYYEKPLRRFRRLLETYVDVSPRGLESWLASMPQWLGGKVAAPYRRNLSGFRGKMVFTEHHESHAASAFFPSPYKSAAILTLDGVGEWTTSAYGIGSENDIELIADQSFPHSLGLLYSAFTYYAGFKVNSGEYKLMGLAPYGRPKYRDLILEKLGHFCDDGSLWLDMKYFNYCQGLTMTSEAFHQLFGAPPRSPESPLRERDLDIARSIQEVAELCIVRTARHVKKVTGERRLCLAGGVSLNCVANSCIHKEQIFSDIWVQPAAGDSGGALGAALSAWYQYYGRKRQATSTGKNHISDQMNGSYLGPEYNDDQIQQMFDAFGLDYLSLERDDLISTVARMLSEQKVVGWFQGRMEFGPRALGNRSILGDPRSKSMQSVMNLKIKFRESFRPFAPSVQGDRAAEFYDSPPESPFMSFVAFVRESHRIDIGASDLTTKGLDKLHVARSTIPAVTHVDYSARLQTVSRDQNPLFYDLLGKFGELTGFPLLVNTSFNTRGEPIVCSPLDALRCFARTHIDCLAIGNSILMRSDKTERCLSHFKQMEVLLD